jgi:hypothetical protein
VNVSALRAVAPSPTAIRTFIDARASRRRRRSGLRRWTRRSGRAWSAFSGGSHRRTTHSGRIRPRLRTVRCGSGRDGRGASGRVEVENAADSDRVVATVVLSDARSFSLVAGAACLGALVIGTSSSHHPALGIEPALTPPPWPTNRQSGAGRSDHSTGPIGKHAAQDGMKHPGPHTSLLSSDPIVRSAAAAAWMSPDDSDSDSDSDDEAPDRGDGVRPGCRPIACSGPVWAGVVDVWWVCGWASRG